MSLNVPQGESADPPPQAAQTSVYQPLLQGAVQDFRQQFSMLTPFMEEVMMAGMFVKIKIVDTRPGEVTIWMDIMVTSLGNVKLVKDTLKGLLRSYTGHAMWSGNKIDV